MLTQGRGIAKELHTQIFEPFFTTKQHRRGLGLGLSVSRSIMESMGGTLDFKSDVGHGTVF